MDSIDRIVIYEGTVTLTTEFHSGAFDGDNATDRPLVRGTDGSVILRGESLAGLIRQELVRYFNNKCKGYLQPDKKTDCNCDVCKLMGSAHIPDAENRVNGNGYRDSRLKVFGGTFNSKGIRIRHGVAIDRPFQTAATHRKYDLEAMLTGAEAPFGLELEAPTDEELAAVEHVLKEMGCGFISLGGRKGAGFGGFTITVTRQDYDMKCKDGVRRYLLREKGPSPVSIAAIASDKKKPFLDLVGSGRRARLMLTFDLWFPELFLVNDPLEAALAGSDHVSVVDGNGKPWLPPSSMRGVFRSRAEQILRTLNPLAACDPSCDKGNRPLLSCAKGVENRRSEAHENDSWPTWKELEKDDFLCLACQMFGSTHLRGKIRFQPGTFQNGKHHEEVLHHFLAIDRFAGGGKEGAKYDAFPLYDVWFTGCRLILEDFESWQAGLIALTFKDLYQSDMRFGFGTRKGFGLSIARFTDGRGVMLSKDKGIYSMNVDASDAEVKTALEGMVKIFREKVKVFEGATYAEK